MLELQRVSSEAIPTALEKAERYRLLNEPIQAESICLDVLEVEPENQKALVTLLLALTDQFTSGTPTQLSACRDLLPHLSGDYEQAYYAGIIAERRAAALVEQGGGQRGYVAYELLLEAMSFYEQARTTAPAGNDDAVLRRNTCIRLINKHPHVRPAPDEQSEFMLE